MENNTSSSEDLKTIRRIMEESTKFLSLSGLSGVFIGLFAIAGAAIAWFIILKSGNIRYEDYMHNMSGQEAANIRLQMIINVMVVLFLSVTTAFLFSVRIAKQSGKSFLTPASKRLLLNLGIPLAAGGVFPSILAVQNNVMLIIPVFLVFYGLALISAGKFTYNEVFYLGIFEIITGLFAAAFPGLGLLFWIIGFGILHIVYGVMMYRKYEV